MSGTQYTIKQNSADSHQSTPWAGVTFLSFNKKDTVNFSSSNNASLNMSVTNYTVVSDIIRIQVNSSKSNNMITAEAVLSSGHLNYQALISPGDHALIWIHDDIGQYQKVMGAAHDSKAANGFNSGLKFIGKVNSVRSAFTTSSNGIKTLRYMVTFKGFSEFSTKVYYNPLLQDPNGNNTDVGQQQNIQNLYAAITTSWQNYLLTGSEAANRVDNLIKFFIKIFLGNGPDSSSTNVVATTDTGTFAAVRSPNEAFLVPKELLSILGLPSQNSRAPNYADVLNVSAIGIQSYSYGGFEPYIANLLYGNLIAIPDLFNDVVLWSLIQGVSNAWLNETYTAIRLDKNNRIVPRFIARQIPFSSIHLEKRLNSMGIDQNSVQYTPFLSLPRWIIDPTMQINSFNIGTSDIARYNFFQVYAQLTDVQSPIPNFAQLAQIKAGNLQMDGLDISRNGTRTLLAQTGTGLTHPSGDIGEIRAWTALVSDWYANGHLKLNGHIDCVGISAPICVGDNLQVAGKVFHIESITHMYEVAEGTGHKSFSTSIDLSNGVLADGTYDYHDPKMRKNITNPLASGYSDEEVYINGRPIISAIANKDSKGK